MKSFALNAGDKDTFDTGNYVGLRICIELTHSTVNTAFAGVVFDWTALQVKMTLMRNGAPFEILSDQALPLILASSFESGTFDEVKGGGSPLLRVLVAHGAATKAKIQIVAEIMFPAILNLTKVFNDQLTVTITNKGGFTAADIEAASSKIEWELIEGIGNATSIPFIKAEMITAGQSGPGIQCGDGVKRVHFINNDKFSVLSADQVINNVTVKSDKLHREDTYAELLAARARQFPTAVIADTRYQSFRLIDAEKDVAVGVAGDGMDDVRLHNVHVKLNLVGGNVNAAKNWIVTSGLIASTPTAQVAVAREMKHVDANATQVLG